jgi:hypothetical protein
VEDAPGMTRRVRRLTSVASALALLALACGPPPAPRGRYTLVSVDGRTVPIDGSFYTPAVGYNADLVGGDLLVCGPGLVVRTDRVREQDTTVPVDDSRAHPHESWFTEALAFKRDGRQLYLARTDASRAAPIDTAALLGRAGDTIAMDRHADRPGATTRRYLFARRPADTADQGHAGTLCAGYMRDRAR